MFCWKSNLQFFYTDVSLDYPSVMLGNIFSAQMIRFQSGLLYFNTLTTGNLLVIFRYFLKMLFIFSSSPFYTDFVCLPRVNDPPSPYIKDNLKFHSFFKMPLEQWMAVTFSAQIQRRNEHWLGIAKAW
jgi:hypothetical protein